MKTSKNIANGKGKSKDSDVKQINAICEAMDISKRDNTLSNHFNQLAKNTVADDNFRLKGWKSLERRIKADDKLNNDVSKLILNKKGYVIFKNHFAKKFWSADRKTAVKGKTWNLFANAESGKKVSMWFIYQLLAKMAKMPSDEFNEIYNFGAKYKAKEVEVAAS